VLWIFVLLGFIALSLVYRKVLVSAARQICGGKYRPLGQDVEMGRR
jgi:hypothetical protein